MIRVIGMHTLVGCVALLAAVACASPTPTVTPVQPSMPTFTPTAPTPTATPTPTPTPAGPCEEEGVDCSPRDISAMNVVRGGATAGAAFGALPDAPNVEDVLAKGIGASGQSPTHIAIQGSAPRETIRCGWHNVVRTLGYREDEIRFWLAIDEDTALPSPSEVERRLMEHVNRMRADHRPEWTAWASALANGGVSSDYTRLKCYADYTVQSYLLGAGPSELTVAYDREERGPSYDLYGRSHAAGYYRGATKLSETEFEARLAEIADEAVDELKETIGNRQGIVFLAPMGAFGAVAVEAWQAVDQWELQTQTTESGAKVVAAVRYGVPQDDSEYSLPYADLKRRVSAAARTDAFAGKRIANASGITQYYRDIGAYGDIAPGDGETTTFTPARTPPHCGLAVGAGASPGLVRDCFALMEGKDTLRGTGSLNWDYGRAIATWDGITVSGTPARVTRLEAQGRKLTGTIPASLGKLSQLTRLYLQDNKLTGSIPPELGDLSNLTHFNLYYNSLSGSIPSELGDLSELRRFYLNSNQLTGSIPSSFGNFSKIWHLYLNDNKLTGGIPSELGNLSTAIHIHLGGNDLSGGVPTWLGNLSRLTWLYLNGNELTGSIPSELGNLSRLLRLSVADNDLSGSIPTQLGNLSKVTHLYLGGNKLTGCVPAALRSVSTNDLSRLSLSNC